MLLPILHITFITLTLAISVLLSLVVYKNNPKNITNLIVSYLCWLNAIWIVITTLTLNKNYYSIILTLIRSTIFIGTLQVLCFYLLVNTLPEKKLKLSKIKIAILSLVTIAVASITMSPYAFTDVQIVNDQAVPTVGPGMPIFALYALSMSVIAIFNLWTKHKKSKGIQKVQTKFILIGMFLMLGLIITTIFVPVVLFKQSQFVGFAPVYVLLFLVSTTYTIVKHRLLDIRLVVTKTLAFSLLILFVGGCYSLLLYYVGQRILNIVVTPEIFFYNAILTLIVTFTFFPLERYFEKITDKIFFTTRHTPQVMLKNLSKATNSSIDLTKLSNTILETIMSEMKTVRGAILVLSQHEHSKISSIYQKGYEKPLDITDSDVEYLSESPETVVFEELGESTKKELLRHFQIAVSIPLISNGTQIGLAIFGEKASGSIYTDEEINVLEIFAPEAAIAIQNALSYEEIIQFNTKLQQEVNKATEDIKSVTEDVYKKNIELNKVSTQLAEANTKLKELDHLKDEFVSLASHELRTPMTAIKSYLWMFLQYNSTTLDPKEHEYIERAYSATDRLITLVNDMLNVSRIESGRMNILFKPVNMIQLTKEVFDELSPSAQKQGVNLKLDSPERLPNITGDQNKIREVLINLIGNSLKFTDSGGSITVKMTVEEPMIKVEVIDTGKGINKEDVPKLFQKFGTLNGNYLTKTNSQGTGLGLYICKSIVQLHGGTITVASEGENKGTTFSFTLKIDDGTFQNKDVEVT